jgi:hypothetical protein
MAHIIPKNMKFERTLFNLALKGLSLNKLKDENSEKTWVAMERFGQHAGRDILKFENEAKYDEFMERELNENWNNATRLAHLLDKFFGTSILNEDEE